MPSKPNMLTILRKFSIIFIYILYILNNKGVHSNIILNDTDSATNWMAAAIEDDINTRVCKGKSICNLPYKPSFEFRKCMCDSNCNVYDDCCADSPYYGKEAKPKTIETFICPSEYKIYMKKSCPTTFSNQTIKSKCENSMVGELNYDPKMLKIVVDTQNNVTYFNSYCAECHGITKFESTLLSYKCNSVHFIREEPQELVRQIMDHMQYHAKFKTFFGDYNGTNYTCIPEIVIPNNLFDHMRPCVPNVVSSCPLNYTNQTVVEQCASFTSLIYTSRFVDIGTIYKNFYCATCNGKTNGLHNCQDLAFYSGGGGSALFRPASSGTATCDGDNSLISDKFC